MSEEKRITLERVYTVLNSIEDALGRIETKLDRLSDPELVACVKRVNDKLARDEAEEER